MYSLTFRVRRYAINACHVHRLPIHAALCCHGNETRAPIANSPNSAQLGAPLPFSQVTSGSVQYRVTTIHFASSTPTTHAKCNEPKGR